MGIAHAGAHVPPRQHRPKRSQKRRENGDFRRSGQPPAGPGVGPARSTPAALVDAWNMRWIEKEDLGCMAKVVVLGLGLSVILVAILIFIWLLPFMRMGRI